MVGLLITGHGKFASGITSSLNLIAGEQENYAYVDFIDSYTPGDLERDLKKELGNMDLSRGAIILADIIGGSPFKVSVLLSQEYPEVYVIGGANLPMLLELATGRMDEANGITELIDTAIGSAKAQIKVFCKSCNPDNNEECEGI